MNYDKQPLITELDKFQMLGFDYTWQALEAIIQDANWPLTWDCMDEETAELRKLGYRFRNHILSKRGEF